MTRLLSLTLLLASCLGLQAKSNIILIFTDDLGYGDLGVLFQNQRTSSKKLSTPSLDSMAAEGTILDRHYCPAPVCAPSRGSLLSGQHQGHANIRNRQFDKALSDNHTLATTLKQAGYYTAAIGKYGLQGTSGNSPATWTAYPTKRGFDYFYGYPDHIGGHQHYPGDTWPLGNSARHRAMQDFYENDTEIKSQLSKCYTTDLFTARAKKIIIDETADNPSRPFFIYLAYDTPHAAIQTPTMPFPTGKGLTGGLQWNGTPGNMINTAAGTIDSYINPLYSGKGYPNKDERFATMVTRIDHCVGDLIQTLKDLEIDDNTLVIFTSDNGPHEESYISGVNYTPTAFDSYGPFEGIKQDVHEGGIRVPSIAWGPSNVQAASIATTPSQFHDWMPTFLDYAEITTPARADGVSLRPTLSGAGIQKPNTVYIEYNVSGSTPGSYGFTNHGGEARGQSQVIYLDGYKGVRTNISSHSTNFRIYNTLSDLTEASNLANTSSYFSTLQQRMKDHVLRIRQPDSAAPRPYDNELVPPVTAAVVNGLMVKTYEGIWPWVPEFEDLTSLSTTEVSHFSTSHLSRNNDAGLYYSGYIRIPADGTWTFYNSSDAGTILRIHDSLVLDDDFTHSGSEASGALKLKAGLHPIRLYYRSGSNTPNLNVQWAGPGTTKAEIPAAALFRNGTPPPEPVANPDNATTSSSSLVSIPVLANDTDDGVPSALSIQSVSKPAFGTAIINGSNIDYTADAGKYGTDQFSYTVTDGQYTATGIVMVHITFASSNLWIPLNETSGSTVTEAGGTLVGTHGGAPGHITGQHGYALQFNGVDDQVNLSGVTLPTGGSSRTIAAWVRTSATSGVENQVILGYGGTANGTRFSFRLDAQNQADQKLRLEVAGGFIVGSTKINDGNWHHVACVIDSATPNVNQTDLYVDGVLETISSSGSQVINTSASGTPSIGGSNHAPNYNFQGDIDEVRVYAFALSAQEIGDLFNATDQPAGSWLYRHFGTAPPAWTDDSDNDGINLLAEYAFGSNPHISDRNTSTPSSSYNPASGKLEATFPRRKANSHNLTYTVQISNDLIDWTTLTASEIASSPHPTLGDEFELVTVETDDTAANEPSLFLRIHVQ